ncbi:MAG: VOC family protein [Pseudomonadota bacterium]
MLEQICPIMPSRNLDTTQAFYAALGFETWYRDDGYLLMNRDRVEVHFFHHPDHIAAESDHGAYIRPLDVDAFGTEVAALDLATNAGAFPRFAAPEDKPWGMREAAIWDPDGNLLRVGTVIKEAPPADG